MKKVKLNSKDRKKNSKTIHCILDKRSLGKVTGGINNGNTQQGDASQLTAQDTAYYRAILK